jgi:vacuolar-type H+-ATPase subunit F/Vma7
MPDELHLDKPFAIVGDEDLVTGFRALGFGVYKDLNEALTQKPAICLVQEEIYQQEKEKINTYRAFALPVFVPFNKATQNVLLEQILRDIRLRATGTF